MSGMRLCQTALRCFAYGYLYNKHKLEEVDMSCISCPWQPCVICSFWLCFLLLCVLLCARHPIGLLLSVACNVCVTVHKLVSFLGQCSLHTIIMSRCSLDHPRYTIASAAASFQPELACSRRSHVRSDQTISLTDSQIPTDVKDETP